MLIKIKSCVAFMVTLLTSSLVFAADKGVLSEGDGSVLAIAIALGIGIVVSAGTISQSRIASSALEGIARNPNAADKVFAPMLLGLGLIESLVLFAWILMLFMQQKL